VTLSCESGQVRVDRWEWTGDTVRWEWTSNW